MNNIEITENNKTQYKKLLAIMEGKHLTNNKCLTIPILLIILEAIITAGLIIHIPFIELYLSKSIITTTEIIIYMITLYINIKSNIKLSKNMSLKYFKKENPDIDIDINSKELKQKLEEYRINKISGYRSYSVKTNKQSKPQIDFIPLNEEEIISTKEKPKVKQKYIRF